MMKTEVIEIETTLKDLLKAHISPLKIRQETETFFEVAGTKERMQGKQKVDGYYFASVMPKPKDVRLYFFPIYTHSDSFSDIPPELRKCLKGKSCFHIKKLSPELEENIKDMISEGISLYVKDDLI